MRKIGFNLDLRADAVHQVPTCECMSMELYSNFKPHQLFVYSSVVPSIQHLPIYVHHCQQRPLISLDLFLTLTVFAWFWRSPNLQIGIPCCSPSDCNAILTLFPRIVLSPFACKSDISRVPLAKSMPAGILAIKTRQKKKKKLLATKPKTLETWHKMTNKRVLYYAHARANNPIVAGMYNNERLPHHRVSEGLTW
ncbi:hypothetical protein GQX74_000540 [Glossina fuscipes]|nr:hypothetical protein GQX74_000540 [Glossina fuscipes]